EKLFEILTFLNSKVATFLSGVLSSTLNFDQGVIARLPVNLNESNLYYLAKENIDISKRDWNSFEYSWDFKIHPLIQFKDTTYKLSNAYKYWENELDKRVKIIKENEKNLNEIFINLYGLQDRLDSDVTDKEITVSKKD